MKTIWLEFQHEAQKGTNDMAANGSDITFYIDGRWSLESTVLHVYLRLAELRDGPSGSTYRKQKFIGYTIAGLHSSSSSFRKMHDPNPPEWTKNS